MNRKDEPAIWAVDADGKYCTGAFAEYISQITYYTAQQAINYYCVLLKALDKSTDLDYFARLGKRAKTEKLLDYGIFTRDIILMNVVLSTILISNTREESMKKALGFQGKHRALLVWCLLTTFLSISACGKKYSPEAMALSEFIRGYNSSYSFTALETYQDDEGYYYIYEESFHDDEHWTGSSSGVIRFRGNEFTFIHKDDFDLPYEATILEPYQALKKKGSGKIYSQEEIAAFLKESEEYYSLTHSETKE